MRKISFVGLLVALAPSLCMGGSLRLNRLVQEKQRKMAELEKCMGSTKGLKIAGISTLGLTAVGVAGNVVEAKKIKDYDTKIASTDKSIEKTQQEIDDTKTTLATKKAEAEATKKAEEEKRQRQTNCTQTGGQWHEDMGVCTCNTKAGYKSGEGGLCEYDATLLSGQANADGQYDVDVTDNNEENTITNENNNVSNSNDGGVTSEDGSLNSDEEDTNSEAEAENSEGDNTNGSAGDKNNEKASVQGCNNRLIADSAYTKTEQFDANKNTYLFKREDAANGDMCYACERGFVMKGEKCVKSNFMPCDSTATEGQTCSYANHAKTAKCEYTDEKSNGENVLTCVAKKCSSGYYLSNSKSCKSLRSIAPGERGKTAVYKDNNGKCKNVEYSSGGSCADISKTEWKVVFNSGVVYGSSRCSATGGQRNKVGNPVSTNGPNCWCKVGNSWVFNVNYGLDINCPSCPYACSQEVFYGGTHRQVLFEN